MKKLTIMLGVFFAVAMVAASSSFAELKRYDIKSAIITYEYTGVQSGTETVYFNDYGNKEARYSNLNLTLMGNSQSTNAMVFVDGDMTYSVNLDTNTAYRMPTSKMTGNDDQKFGAEAIVAMGGEKIGTKEVLGKKCDLYNLAQYNNQVCLYKGFPLHVETNAPNFNMQMVATKLEEKADIPEGKLVLPDGVQIMDMPNIMPIQEQGEASMEDIQAMMEEQSRAIEAQAAQMEAQRDQ